MSEFEEISVSDFFLKLHFFYKNENRKLEYIRDLTRIQTTMLMSIHTEKKLKVDEIWPIEEIIVQEKEIDVERINHIIKKVWD